MSALLRYHRRIALTGASTLTEWLLLLLLMPFSIMYGMISLIRNKFYDLDLCASYRAAVPVVSVGNIAVGGTGKTPVVDWLLKEFIKLGKAPAVVSRGYGGTFSGKVGIVSSGDGLLLSADDCGDEPFLLARRNPKARVLIARKRADGIRIAVAELGADVIILDDGFQHRAVARDLDLVLLDASRPYGNGWTLPAGLLRERPSSLKRADYFLMTRATLNKSDNLMGFRTYNSQHQLANIAIDLNGNSMPVDKLKKLNLLGFAGIADPDNFFGSLENSGLTLRTKLAFADHADYHSKLVAQLQVATVGVDALITTEKDAVKLSADMFELPCYQIPMDINIDNSAELIMAISKKLWS